VVFLLLVVHLAEEVLETISDYEVVCLQFQIVTCNLIENVLINSYARGFAFYDYLCLPVFVKHQDISSFYSFFNLALLLDCDQRSRILLALHQVLDKVLSHPFFFRQEHLFFSVPVKDIELIFFTFDPERISRKI